MDPKLRALYRTESIVFSGGPTAAALDSVEQQTWHTRVLELDARKAEVLAELASVHPLERVRTLLLRGHLNDASKLLRELGLSAEVAGDSTLQVEVQLEEARRRIFDGEWEETLRLCNRLLERSPGTVSAITAYQLRAIAFHELGDFPRALRDLELVSPLSALFPNGPSVFYARAYRPKVLARSHGLTMARDELNRLWAAELRGAPNPDHLIVLAKAETDLALFSGEGCAAGWALMAHNLAQKIGDQLYQGISLLEYWIARPGERAGLDDLLIPLARAYRRIRQTLDAIRGETPVAESAGTTILTHVRAHRSPPKCADCARLEHSAERIHDPTLFSRLSFWLPQQQALIHAGTKAQIIDLSRQKGAAALLDALRASGKRDRATLFGALYGNRKFVPHLHDAVIRNALSRLRRQTGLNIVCEDAQYRAEDIHAIH